MFLNLLGLIFLSSRSHWCTTLGNTATFCVNPSAMGGVGGWCPEPRLRYCIEDINETMEKLYDSVPWSRLNHFHRSPKIWMFCQGFNSEMDVLKTKATLQRNGMYNQMMWSPLLVSHGASTMTTHILDVHNYFPERIIIKNPARLGHESVVNKWRFFKDFGEKIQQPIFRSIQFSHILAVQVGTEVDDRVYFSPLRGNAWKLRSWNGRSWEAMNLWRLWRCYFWFTRQRCLKSSKIWNILTSAPCFQAFFQKLWQLFLLWWVRRSCLAQHSLEPWQYRHWWQVHRLRCTVFLTCQSAAGSSSAYFWEL